jgi:hypothetical protein
LNGATSVSAVAPGVTPGLSGRPNVADARPRLHEQRVGVPVVAAVELDELVPPGGRAGDAQRAHRRLEPLDTKRTISTLGSARRCARRARPRLDRGAEARAALGLPPHRLDHLRVRVPGRERAPRHHVVDVLGAVHVGDARAAARRHHARRAAHGPEGAHGAAHAPRDHVPRAGDRGGGARGGRGVGGGRVGGGGGRGGGDGGGHREPVRRSRRTRAASARRPWRSR